MNPTKQKNHKTAMKELEVGVVAFTESAVKRMDELDVNIQAARAVASGAVGEERTARLKMAEEQRAYVDRNEKALLAALCALRDRGFWGRMKWIVRGL